MRATPESYEELSGRGLEEAGTAGERYSGQDLPRLMTARDVAAYLRMHVVTIYRLAESGKLPGLKIGRQWRFSLEDIQQWSRANRVHRVSPQALVLTRRPQVWRLIQQALRSTEYRCIQARTVSELLRHLGRSRVVCLDATHGLPATEVPAEELAHCRLVVLLRPGPDGLPGWLLQVAPVTLLSEPFSPDEVRCALGCDSSLCCSSSPLAPKEPLA